MQARRKQLSVDLAGRDERAKRHLREGNPRTAPLSHPDGGWPAKKACLDQTGRRSIQAVKSAHCL